jgi:hypothetical protein
MTDKLLISGPPGSPKAKFPLGRLVITPGAQEACSDILQTKSLNRHQSGDWGILDPEDARQNDRALASGMRIMSAYAIDESKPCKGFGPNTLWIITEADRSATTLLLPDEY